MATPQHYIYNSSDVLVYTIGPAVDRDPPIVIDVPDNVKLSNLRANGKITIPGGNKPYLITIYAYLDGANYTSLMAALEALETAIPVNTNLFLKYDKTLVNNESLESIKVQRVSLDIDKSRGKLTTYCFYTLVLDALSWQ